MSEFCVRGHVCECVCVYVCDTRVCGVLMWCVRKSGAIPSDGILSIEEHGSK
jgi:hypothetical protein